MTTDAPDPQAVIEAFGLEGPVDGWEPVGGAWSNRVYRLDAGGRRYAVKELRNPWADPRWQEWLAEAWSFEQQAIAAGVDAPQPVPNPADGTCLAWVRRSVTTACRRLSRITGPAIGGGGTITGDWTTARHRIGAPPV